MWPFNRDRITKRLNTVDLNDDLDDVEMLQEIERTFRFELQQHEAEDLVNVGNLYDLVKQKASTDPDFDPVWHLVERIVRTYSGSDDPIDRETTFFPKFAKPRE